MINVLLMGFPGENDKRTGGIIVDYEYEKILSGNMSCNIDVKGLDESGFSRYVYSSKKKREIVRLLKKYDVLVIDARAYTRFCTVISYIRRRSAIKIYAVVHHFYYKQIAGCMRIPICLSEMYTFKQMDGLLFAGNYSYNLAKKIRALKGLSLTYIGIGFDNSAGIVKRQPFSNHNIVFIGHIIPRKGLHYLVKALEKLKKEDGLTPTANIIGDTKVNLRYTRKLMKMIKKADLSENVKLRGRIGEEEKDEILKESGIFVFPSLCEGFGMVILEAMRYGIPAIVFNNTSMPFSVSDSKNGYVVKNKSWTGLYEKIKLIYEGDVYDNLSKGAEKTYLRAMSWDDVASNLNTWVFAVAGR